MAKFSKTQKTSKPCKPSRDFPLFAHQNGQWAKKVRGKLHYFGLWDDPNTALHRWLDDKDELLAGRKPREKTADGVTLKAMFDRFLSEKSDRLDSGELSPRTLKDYCAVCQFIADALGKNRLAPDVFPADFALLRRKFAKVHGPVRLAKDITITRMAFKFGYESGLLETPIRFGPNFKAPTKRNLRKAKRESGKRDFDAHEIRKLLDALSGVELTAPDENAVREAENVTQKTNPALKAMILLGANCGFGQSDCANLLKTHVDLDSGWIDYPRPKTEVDRKCPLWPETVQALQEAMENRPATQNPDDDECVFLTRYGNRWVRMSDHSDPAKRTAKDAVAQELGKVMQQLGINGRRSFYALRHTFETQAGESRDQVAVDRIMGHSDQSMAANYRHRISDERLKDVVNVVREWLWPPENDTNNDSVDIIQFTTAG